MPDPMPTLCPIGGPLPEKYRSFIVNGELRAGDAVGLEAQWILSGATICDHNYIPEDDYTLAEIDEHERGKGCVICGDEDADTVRGECRPCRGLPPCRARLWRPVPGLRMHTEFEGE